MKNKGLLLDTHTWIWLMVGNDALSKKNQKLIDEYASEGKIYLSTISLWEVSMLTAKNKIHLDRPCYEWIEDALTEPTINLVTLKPDIAIESAYLPGQFHGDPADRIIVATARIETLVLMTKDRKILDYSKNKYLNTIEA